MLSVVPSTPLKKGHFMNTEQKQSINLSHYAISILHEDMEMFAPGQTFTGFLNDIIERYCDRADASIYSAIEKQRTRLRLALDHDPLLSGNLKKDQLEHIVRLLDSETESRLLNKARLYDSGKSFTFRLNNRNCQHFSLDSELAWPDTAYYGGYYSRYLKAVIEEYCELPRFNREEIYFQEHLETIQHAIDAAKLLRVEMESPFSNSGKETWDVRPFALMPDASHLYHYLIGKSVRAGGLRRDERIASIRLSRIRKLELLSKKTSRSGMLSASEKKEIRQKIRSNTVYYLIGDECEIIIRFTDAGIQMYKNILFLRPSLHHVDNEGCYHFLCTQMQALRYFIPFGAEAEILSPQELRKTFAEKYRDAAKKYTD